MNIPKVSLPFVAARGLLLVTVCAANSSESFIAREALPHPARGSVVA